MSEKLANRIAPFVILGGIAVGTLWLGYAMFAAYNESTTVIHIKK